MQDQQLRLQLWQPGRASPLLEALAAALAGPLLPEVALLSLPGSGHAAAFMQPSGLVHLLPIDAASRARPTFLSPSGSGSRKAVVHDLQRPDGTHHTGAACSLAARGPCLAVGWANGSCSLLQLAAAGAEYRVASHHLCKPPAAAGRILRSLLSRHGFLEPCFELCVPVCTRLQGILAWTLLQPQSMRSTMLHHQGVRRTHCALHSSLASWPGRSFPRLPTRSSPPTLHGGALHTVHPQSPAHCGRECSPGGLPQTQGAPFALTPHPGQGLPASQHTDHAHHSIHGCAQDALADAWTSGEPGWPDQI